MIIHCPVPGCCSTFNSSSAFLNHLLGVIRRNRCGAFQGVFEFLCTCGEMLTCVSQLRLHCIKHMRRRHGSIGMIAPPDVEECRDTGESPVTSEDNNPLPTHEEVDDEEEEHMYLYAEAPVEDDDTDSDDDDGINWNNDCLDDAKKVVLMDLCQYAYNSLLTQRCYKLLRKMPLFASFDYIPYSLKHLRCLVDEHLSSDFKFPAACTFPLTHDGVEYRVPYLSIKDALSIWLSIPGILSAVRSSNARYLPSSLVNEDEFSARIAHNKFASTKEHYTYDSIESGSSYLERVKECIPVFIDEYLRAVDDGCDIILCTVGLYSDDFKKNQSSLISQTMYCLTLVEASVGVADLYGVTSLVAMLASAKVTKAIGHNPFWKVLVNELKKFEEGVRMNVEGSECLVICLSHPLLGDTPAIKTMCGYSPSISATCYNARPCMICDIKVEHLRDSLRNSSYLGATRTLAPLQRLYECNSRMTGQPRTAWIRESMKQHGYLLFPEFLRLTNQPNPELLSIDSMHAQLKGALMKHFLRLVDVLSSGEGSVRNSKFIWTRISKEFTMYCRSNGISAFCSFTSKKQFQMRMTANSMKEFSRVASLILLNLELVKTSPLSNSTYSQSTWKKHAQAFRFWCIHADIARILEQHRITSFELSMLDSVIPELLSYFATDCPEDFVSINIHYYLHMVDQIRRLGPLRIVSNHSREQIIRKLKPFYHNTNNRQTEVSVFQRYRIGLFFQIRQAASSKNTFEFSRDSGPFNGAPKFDFYYYDNVIVDEYGRFQVFTRTTYSLLSFRSNPLGDKKAKWKLDFTALKRDDYIYVTANNSFPVSHVGRLVAILEQDGALYIAYTVPQVANLTRSFESLSFQPWYVSAREITATLYVCPADYFTSRLLKYDAMGVVMLVRK